MSTVKGRKSMDGSTRKSVGKNKTVHPGFESLKKAIPETRSLCLDKDELCLYAASVIETLRSEKERMQKEIDNLREVAAKERMAYSESLLVANKQTQVLKNVVKLHALPYKDENMVEPYPSASADYAHVMHDCIGRNLCVQCTKKLFKD